MRPVRAASAALYKQVLAPLNADLLKSVHFALKLLLSTALFPR